METSNQEKTKMKRYGFAFFSFLANYIFRILIMLPLMTAFIIASLAAWPFWVWESLHQKKDCIKTHDESK